MRSQDNWNLSFSKDQLQPLALEAHCPMPPLAKEEFIPLQNVMGMGKISNPFVKETTRRTPQPSCIVEVPPRQTSVHLTVNEPPPVVVETAPHVAEPTPPVFTAAPRQYVHPSGENVYSIPVIPHSTPGRVADTYPPVGPTRPPVEQYWRPTTREYRPYVAEPTYDYSN